MGIQDRDYYREGPSFLDRVGQQGATVWLVAITCGVFVGQVFSGLMQSPLLAIGEYNPRLILEGEVWRVFTPLFLHESPAHLIFNMLVLFLAGQRVEEIYGAREFVLFYLVSGVCANLAYLGIQVAGLTDMGRVIGASGAVLAVLVVFACYYPHAPIRLWFLVPMPVWVVAVFVIGLDVILALNTLAGNDRLSRTAYFVHLGGALCGLLYYQSAFRFTHMFARAPKPRLRPKLRVVAPPEDQTPEPVGAPVEAAPRPVKASDEQLEAKLDAVLEKVSKHGQESLTQEEREILFKASELYKKRRK